MSQYRVEIPCSDQDGRYYPVVYDDVRASSALEAAKKFCPKGITEDGNNGNLVAIAYPVDPAKRLAKYFYMPK
jgi:hypothetical protein